MEKRNRTRPLDTLIRFNLILIIMRCGYAMKEIWFIRYDVWFSFSQVILICDLVNSQYYSQISQTQQTTLELSPYTHNPCIFHSTTLCMSSELIEFEPIIQTLMLMT